MKQMFCLFTFIYCTFKYTTLNNYFFSPFSFQHSIKAKGYSVISCNCNSFSKEIITENLRPLIETTKSQPIKHPSFFLSRTSSPKISLSTQNPSLSYPIPTLSLSLFSLESVSLAVDFFYSCRIKPKRLSRHISVVWHVVEPGATSQR